MARFFKKETKKPGSAPGSLIFVGTRKTEKVSIDVIRYADDKFDSFKDISPDEIKNILTEDTTTWINIVGLHDTDIIDSIGKLFSLHPLFLEDVLNPDQRPKFDTYENFNVFFLKMLRLDEARGKVETEQIAIAAGKNYLISFQEAADDVFDPVRDRLIRATTKIRTRGADYLAFALMDAIVDNYIVSIEYFGNKIELLEGRLLRDVEEEELHMINSYKREINGLRRTIRPVLELAMQYHKSESILISSRTVPFIKDLVDHSTQAAEAIEIYKELLNDELSLYHTTMNNRLNDTIRTLTIFSVIFIPLTFIAGIYGTNFEYFPELEYRYAYPIFWGVLIIIAGIMLMYFKRKGWLK